MEKNKKNMARNLKLHEVLPSIATLLQLIQICPASGAVAERGFSLMNLIMNNLRNAMNIATLDATMRITYVNEITDDVVEKIIGIWKKHGNRRIELLIPTLKKNQFCFY